MDEHVDPQIENRSAKSENTPWTVGALLDWTAQFLARKQAELPRLDTEVLLAHVLGCNRIDLYGARHGEIATDATCARLRELIRRRVDGCPVAYLVGRKEFFSLVFDVSPAVLIPRPDTEVLVLECLKLARPMPSPRIVDIGTGSGNIAVALARQHPGADITAIDLSSDALALAQRNAARNAVRDRIRFLQGDLFAPIPAGEQLDFVLSNPPYIATEDLGNLPVGVRDFEPRLALDGGPGGYVVFNRLIEAARGYLAPGGHLLVEIGSAQEAPARDRLASHGCYRLEDTLHDNAGHPRVLHARYLPVG